MHGRREKSSPRAAQVFAEAGQLLAAGDDYFRAILDSVHSHGRLSCPAYDHRCPPTNDNEQDQDLPTIFVPISGHGEMVAEHDKHDRNR